jgi:predicted negative regulator of RcsB-dependent stress response
VRAEARHQMKEDRFSEVTLAAWERAYEWSANHLTAVIGASVVVVVIACAAFGGWYYLDQQDRAASTALNQAVRTMNTGIRPAGMPAQPDYPSFASSEERATAAHKQLEAVVAQYPHTHSAEFAHYLLGVTDADLGNTSDAESQLNSVAGSSNDDLAALAKLALASIYRTHGKEKEAVDLYNQLIAKPTRSVGKATAQLELAATYQENNQTADARKTYEQVQKDNPRNPAGEFAMSKLQDMK